MNARHLQSVLAVAAVVGLAWWASTALAQNGATVEQPGATSAVPQLSYGVSDILKLAQAKVSDATIIAYIKTTGNSYGLNAAQIIYLRQQGVSEAVITTMLNQPKPGVAPATVPLPTTPAPQPVPATAYAQPAEPYAESEPTVYYDYEPYYYPVYSYGYWAWPVVVSYGWGGHWYRGWHGGGVWHGGAVVHGGDGGWHSGGNAGWRR
jgi:hypothetical protein